MSERRLASDSQRLIQEGLSHIDQGITIFDRNLKMIAWNTRFLELCEFPDRLAFPGADFESFIRHNALRGEYGPGDVDVQVEERVTDALRFERHQFERERPDGTVIEVTGSPLPAGGFVTTYTDITHIRKRQAILESNVAERTAALKLSEERLRIIANEVPAGIAHVDRDLTILYANSRFAHAYGVEPAQLVGKNARDVLHPRTIRESSYFFEQSRRGAVVDFDMKVELPNGEIREIRTFLRPERPSSGEVIGFYLLSIDVTRSKVATSALLGAQKMDALGRMASGISHDFNNLLTIILGNLVPLSEELGSGEINEEYLAPAIAAARRGSNLTKRLLMLARREPFDPKPVDTEDAIGELVKLLRSSIPATLRISHKRSGRVPPAFVDHAQLEMALLNLAVNARDATADKGHITIETDLCHLDIREAELRKLPEDDYIRIRFADDGTGMSPEIAEKIFEPFFTSKAAGGGSGLGLSMVYGFIRQSNGAIWVDSQPGKGSIFTILLPIWRPHDDVPDVAEEDLDDDVQETPNDLGRIVLLVDDEAEVRRAVRGRIARLGYALIEADNADAALGLLEKVREIGIVVTDIDMPGSMDGVGLARVLRKRFPQTRVVLMSGHDFPEGADEVVPANAMLSKPFSAAALKAALDGSKKPDPKPEQAEALR